MDARTPDPSPLAALIDALLDAWYPRRCALCGAACPGATACAEHALPRVDPHPRCGRCAARLPAVLPDGTPCASCRLHPVGLRGTVCLGDYGDPALRAWVLALKHGGRRDLAESLGAALGERLLERGVAVGTPVVPVPLAWLRRHERGHDQALGLAKGVALALDAPVVRALRRARWTAPQGSLLARPRRANVAGAFALRRAASRLAGRDVVLVDDVATSGATLAECARALRRAGAAHVRPAVVARAAPRAEGTVPGAESSG